MSISTIRRQVKNVAYNFSDAQVKVREATSNDPWGPSTALMSEIADLTHNPMSFTEIMSMLWKRLNDHGKNWRHVYKSLVLLDYLIKCGSEKVAQQCRENIYSIETLKDFQHIEENRDQGINVREKAKQMVTLLYDEERLKNERTKFLMTRKKFMSGSAISSDASNLRNIRRTEAESELEDARPSSAGEEEMQLQIALALSKEENEKEEELRKKDDIGLQMAINESRREIERMESAPQNAMVSGSTLSQSAIDDLLSLGVGQPVEQSMPNPWGGPVVDPWAPSPSNTNAAAAVGSSSMYPNLSLNHAVTAQSQPVDPWAPSSITLDSTPSSTTAECPVTNDPWNAPPAAASLQPTRLLQPTDVTQSSSSSDLLTAASTTTASSTTQADDGVNGDSSAKQRLNTKTPESFLGENSALVNLDNLMGTATSAAAGLGAGAQNTKTVNNPFLVGSSSAGSLSSTANNPFMGSTSSAQTSRTLNELMSSSQQHHPTLQQFPTATTASMLSNNNFYNNTTNAQQQPFNNPFLL